MSSQHARDPTRFAGQVMDAVPGGDALRRCFQCGVCGGSCPCAPEMDHTPSRLFAMVRAGLRSEVLHSNTPWFCVACYYCVARCPEQVPIADLMFEVKRLATREGVGDETRAQDFSQAFVSDVERHGRSFGLGLAARYHLTHSVLALPGLARLGLELALKGRLRITAQRIRDIEGLRAILNRARTLEGA